jgi:hypothetical protein
MIPEEENNLFICEIPNGYEFLNENNFKEKVKNYNCSMMNYWARKALKFPTETDTYLSQTAMKILGKFEPNKEKSEVIYEIFNRVWTSVMSQGMKYLDEESMEDIIISCTYHTTMYTLSRSIYKENQRNCPETQKAGTQAVYD